MQVIVTKIRDELARQGVEFTPEVLNEIIHALAYIASFVGGDATLDPGGDWGLRVIIDKEEPDGDECFVEVLLWSEDDAVENDPRESN